MSHEVVYAIAKEEGRGWYWYPLLLDGFPLEPRSGWWCYPSNAGEQPLICNVLH